MAKRPTLVPAQAPEMPAIEADVDFGLGEIIIPIQPWEPLGEISRAESGELKARNDALDRLNADVKHLVSLRAIATNEKVDFMRKLAERLGGGKREEFNINDETGLVHRVGIRRYAKPAPPEPEPTTESTEDAATEAASGDAPEGLTN